LLLPVPDLMLCTSAAQGHFDGRLVQLTKRHQQRRKRRKGPNERDIINAQHLPEPGLASHANTAAHTVDAAAPLSPTSKSICLPASSQKKRTSCLWSLWVLLECVAERRKFRDVRECC
jgi:hypothetical protein